MNLIYEDVDITEYVEIKKADLIDNAGARLDSLEIQFSDTEGLWSKWKPSKGDKIQVIHNGFKSGIMYTDELEQMKGTFIIRALSIPQEAKNSHNQTWEAVRFLEFATQIASRYGFELKTYEVQNYLYDRIDQCEQADFYFLSCRALIEGYIMKISNNTINLYNEAYMEGLTSVKTISLEDFTGSYKFLNKSINIYGGCKVLNNGFNAEFKPGTTINGPILKYKDIYIANQAEANRYAANLLRASNKQENVGKFTIKLDTDLAATSNINIDGVGLADGKYFCQEVIHQFMEDKTIIKCRKPLEGY